MHPEMLGWVVEQLEFKPQYYMIVDCQPFNDILQNENATLNKASNSFKKTATSVTLKDRYTEYINQQEKSHQRLKFCQQLISTR